VFATSPTLVTPALGTPSSATLTNATGYTTANLVGTISNAQLANSTISGVSLGSSLANLTAGTNITFNTGTTYNGSAAITINATGASQVYPAAGIANSTGSAWGTSYSTTGSGTVVALATSPTFVTPILGTPTSGTLTNTTGFPAANLAGTALPSAIVTSSLTALGTVATGVWNGTAIGIAYGGTGQTTKAAAFNALSPITTTGDLIIGNGSNSATRLAIGANTYVLTSDGTTASWQAASGGGASQATPTALGTVYAKQTTGGSTPYLTAFGYNAAVSTTGANCTALGTSALYTNTSGSDNISIGYQSGYLATGSYSTFIGYRAGYNNTASAAGNVFIGYNTGNANTSGDYNTAIGQRALQENISGGSNTALGFNAGYYQTGGNNTVVGASALVGASGTSSGTYNTAIGDHALAVCSTQSSNTCIGANAGYLLTTGSGANTFIGYLTGGWSGGGITTGTQNISIGYNTGGSSTGVNYTIVLGTSTSADKGTSTGFINPNSGGVYQGNNSATWSVASDQRLKKNIVDNNVGLDKVIQIQVRNFEYRNEDEVTDLPKSQAIKKEGIQLGVIAQELQQILPDCVKTESTRVMSVDSTNIMWHMINAIKELNAKVIALEARGV
jgi:hypothetical protein